MMLDGTRRKCKQIRDRVYPESEWPGVIIEQAIVAAAPADGVFLDIGCGRAGRLVKRVAQHYKFSLGIDDEIAPNSMDCASWCLVAADAHCLPLESRSVDVIAMQHVVEHLGDPAVVMQECARVLRPGGRLVVQTVSKWFPPIMLGRLFPHRLRQILNRIATGTNDEDTFKAYYRANTGRALVLAADAAGLRCLDLRYLSHHPRYLMFSVTLYRAGILVEHVVRRYHRLRRLRHFLEAVFELPGEKPVDDESQSGSGEPPARAAGRA